MLDDGFGVGELGCTVSNVHKSVRFGSALCYEKWFVDRKFRRCAKPTVNRMRLQNLFCLIIFGFASCAFPSRKMSKSLTILQPNFVSIHNAILNENIDSNTFAGRKMRIPYYSSDTTIRTLLTRARVHNYEVIDSASKIVRLDWIGEEYSYYLFLGINNRLVTLKMLCEGRCRSLWLGDSVLLQRHYTALVVVY
jgi:hypothetical protein